MADGVDAVRAAARDELRKGAHHLKVMASGGVASPTDRIDSTQYSMDELRAVVQEAEAANRYVAAHAYTARAVNRALVAGIRSIEHGNLLDDESVRLFTEHDAYLVPTLVTYWALKKEGRSSVSPPTATARWTMCWARGSRRWSAPCAAGSGRYTGATSWAECTVTRTRSSAFVPRCRIRST
ncbi:amidohydrolase family protein [Streptomyces sp. M10(2022)]